MNIGTLFQNLTTKGQEWGGYFVMFLGVIAMIVAVYNIVMGFIRKGQQTNWVMLFFTLLVGGFLLATGANLSGVLSFANFGTQTLQDLATP